MQANVPIKNIIMSKYKENNSILLCLRLCDVDIRETNNTFCLIFPMLHF